MEWTAYTGDDFQYYRVIVCDPSQYKGTYCDGIVFQSDAYFDQNHTGPVNVPNLLTIYGYGVVLQTWRTAGALKSYATLPAPPADLKAVAGDGSVTLSWADPGDSSITGYEYNVNHNDTGTGNFTGWGPWQSIPGNGAATTSHTLPRLANGKEYRYHLRAVNTIGAGAQAPNAHPWFVSAEPQAPTPTPTPTPAPGEPNLAAGSATAKTVTLTLSNYSAPWYFKRAAVRRGKAGASRAADGVPGTGRGIGRIGRRGYIRRAHVAGSRKCGVRVGRREPESGRQRLVAGERNGLPPGRQGVAWRIHRHRPDAGVGHGQLTGNRPQRKAAKLIVYKHTFRNLSMETMALVARKGGAGACALTAIAWAGSTPPTMPRG